MQMTFMLPMHLFYRFSATSLDFFRGAMRVARLGSNHLPSEYDAAGCAARNLGAASNCRRH